MKKKAYEIQKENTPRFTRQCVCGSILEVAYNPDLNITFWNCFNCFPMYERVYGEQRKEFEDGFYRSMGKNNIECFRI